MHQLMIYIGTDVAFSETAKHLGEARKRAKFIVKNGYEVIKPEGALLYPPHRIERIDIIPQGVTVVQDKKEEEEDA